MQVILDHRTDIDIRFLYTGREWDAAADLYHYRRRWYDPALQKFISEDPLGFAAGDENITRYVSNRATNATDPSGLEVVKDSPSYYIERVTLAGVTYYHVWKRGSFQSGWYGYLGYWSSPDEQIATVVVVPQQDAAAPEDIERGKQVAIQIGYNGGIGKLGKEIAASATITIVAIRASNTPLDLAMTAVEIAENPTDPMNLLGAGKIGGKLAKAASVPTPAVSGARTLVRETAEQAAATGRAGQKPAGQVEINAGAPNGNPPGGGANGGNPAGGGGGGRLGPAGDLPRRSGRPFDDADARMQPDRPDRSRDWSPTRPSGHRDDPRNLTGELEPLPHDAPPEMKRGFRRQRETAVTLARAGYRVEQSPSVPVSRKKPDLRVEGKIFDVYSPTSSSPESIIKGAVDKVVEGQTRRVVINLADTDGVTRHSLTEAWSQFGSDIVEEIIIIDKDGSIIHFIP